MSCCYGRCRCRYCCHWGLCRVLLLLLLLMAVLGAASAAVRGGAHALCMPLAQPAACTVACARRRGQDGADQSPGGSVLRQQRRPHQAGHERVSARGGRSRCVRVKTLCLCHMWRARCATCVAHAAVGRGLCGGEARRAPAASLQRPTQQAGRLMCPASLHGSLTARWPHCTAARACPQVHGAAQREQDGGGTAR